MTAAISAKTQNLAAFSDYKNYFFVFDDGKIMQEEYMPVKSFQVGGNAIAYIDNSNSFKVYYKGETVPLADWFMPKYVATDYLVVFALGQRLKVFDNGKTTLLANYAESYYAADSLVSFYDLLSKSFKVYYKGTIITLEDALDEPPVKNFKTGDNILAYVNHINEFKIFYRGASFTQTTIDEPLPYEAGKNIVAYYDERYPGFRAFYKGSTYDLEGFPPKSMVAADDMVAYIALNGELKVFYDGKITTIASFEPSFYKVEDSIIVFTEQNYFKAFYKGKIYTLENYTPSDFHIDFNTIAYLDQQGRLKAFYNGQVVVIANEKINQFDLYRNVITYKIFNNNYVYYKSKIYNP